MHDNVSAEVGVTQDGQSLSFEAALSCARRCLSEGQALEVAGDYGGAVRAYDRAPGLLPGEPACVVPPPLARELGLLWMNRGNALQKLDGAQPLDDAIVSYRCAIVQLENAALEAASRVTLGCAWMNLGTALQKRSLWSEAGEACEHAIGILEALSLDVHVARMLAAAWMNLGSAVLAGEKPETARALACARAALSTIGSWEKTDATSADVGWRARRLFCEVCAQYLTREPRVDAPASATVLAEASDVAEEALDLIRSWEKRGATGFEPVTQWFLRFAASLYAEYQPQFLAEFLLDSFATAELPADTASRATRLALASEALSRARLRLHSLVFSDPTAAGNELRLEALRSFEAVDRRLAELSGQRAAV